MVQSTIAEAFGTENTKNFDQQIFWHLAWTSGIWLS